MRVRGDRRSRWLGRWLAAAAAALALSGCGGGNPYQTVPVSGKLTYKDGSLIPAQRIQVNFIPEVKAIDPKTHPHPGIAYVDVETGEFTAVTTATYGDGATVGKNKVQIIAVDENQRPSKAVPAKYADPTTSDLEVEIGPGSSLLELEIDRP